jgi:3'-phosphoadenosine 5'-phosphosulfate sulfotransferase (PAPS reductase)/FAD synthetase
MNLTEKLTDSKKIFEAAVKKYKPDVIIALISGGDDSMAMYQVAQMIGYVNYVVHVDTTTGILDATNFVSDNVKHELIITRTDEETFEDMVLQYGFPGPSQHSNMYIRLKERALRLVQRRFQNLNSFCRIDGGTAHKKTTPLIFHPKYPESEALVIKKPARKIMYLAGGRKDESVRRMGTVKDIQKEGNVIWVNIISNWTKSDIYHLQKAENLKRSPTAILLGRSGECNCGAYGHPNEILEMKYHFPHDPNVAMIIRLQNELKAKGHKFCNYGHGGMNNALTYDSEVSQPMCSTCINNANFNHLSGNNDQ